MGLGWGQSEITISDVVEIKTGRLNTRRLIERHTFTEAQRSPFRSDGGWSVPVGEVEWVRAGDKELRDLPGSTKI